MNTLKHKWTKVLAWIAAILAVILIILIGVAGAYTWNRGYFGDGSGYGMMGWDNEGHYFRMGRFGGKGTGMMGSGYWNSQNSQVFGVIKSINGNKITITNNAGASEIVVTSANTAIINNNGSQIGLSALKTGQNIVVTGYLNQNSQLQAYTIEVQ